VRNLEYKARIEDPKPFIANARELGFDLWGDLRQTDTYFCVARGRLKLRETAGRQGELIFYERDESAPNRGSDYDLVHIADPVVLRNLLTSALGVLAVVKKRRTLLVMDATRLHLDNVDGRGAFLEIEVPVQDGGDAEARDRLNPLLEAFRLRWEDCIRASYLDLTLEAENESMIPRF
jgi:predicted adenylyl cyclase CyaB